jgi:hypothetical protein
MHTQTNHQAGYVWKMMLKFCDNFLLQENIKKECEMLSLLGSVLGFGTSFLPKILGFFEEKRNQAHELAMMDKQLEQQQQIGAQKPQMVNVDADIRETEALHKEHATITRNASQWCINLSASVRLCPSRHHLCAVY